MNKYEFKGTHGEWGICWGGEWIGSGDARNKGGIVCNPPRDHEEMSLREWEHNKHLIAAAPELLQACIEMVEECRKGYLSERIPVQYDKMEAAIHKALNINE